MADTKTNNVRNGNNVSQQAVESCSQNYKPWIWTLVLMAVLTLGWTVYESYEEGGIVKTFLESDNPGQMAQNKMSGMYNSGMVVPVKNMQDTYHGIIDLVRPAVISIDAGIGSTQNAGNPGMNYSRVGSGVIIDPRGFVLSSLHVVAGASSLRAAVYGQNGSKNYPLKVVNVDKGNDLVLLRIIGKGTQFAHAVLGDSDATRTGDVVLAMGSPFGFDHTITTGIISSRNRTLNIGGQVYEGVIQTDTPINKGNSGGPLVSVSGEVIGINTAIYSPTGAFSGIGFAIPVNVASSLVAGVVDFNNGPTQVAAGQMGRWKFKGKQVGNKFRLPNGQVVVPPHNTRGKCTDCHPQLLNPAGLMPANVLPGVGLPVAGGTAVNADPFLGATFLEVNPVIAEQFGLLHAGGVLVDTVYPGTPAERAGMSRGDIILRVDGERVNDVLDFRQIVNADPIGTKYKITILNRNGRKTVKLKSIAAPAYMPGQVLNNQVKEFGWMGSEIGPLTATIAPYVKTGVLVTDADGALRAAGVMKGDVIKSINTQNVTDMATFMMLTRGVTVQEGFLLDVVRNGSPMYITVKG
ncbi:trypsin-like peptidase domain-containing protein [bacterium]|nr:trypsin-like peptidase domain-containing protein [bacterium]